MNFNILLLLLTIFLSCQTSKNNFSGIEKFEKYPNSIIISCTKCNCIIDELNVIFEKKPNLLKPYTIYGDSKCLKNLKPTYKYFCQDSLDKLSLHFYNMLIIKQIKNKVIVNQVETMQSANISDLLKF